MAANSFYGKKPSPGMLSSAFREVKQNPPAIVQSTRRKYGAERARKQQIAIALNKARKGNVV